MTDIAVPVSPGELIDKLTILRLKGERIGDPAKLANVRHEEAVLMAVARTHLPASARLESLWQELHDINARLWVIEDDIRDCERQGDFGPRFIGLARSVYRVNDERAAVKKAINLHLGSAITEEKSYADYRDGGSGA
ncbi:MAG: hypothetical protein IT542_03555 [Rubellimicrobium sp.]|nr:hypothetical protein [Rubellimicrobium sp.]